MVARTYTSLPPIIDEWFQFLFHSPPGVLFTFPSRYSFTIGHRVVCSLGRWSSQIPTGFHVSRGTQELPRVWIDFVYRTITVYGQPFHTVPLSILHPALGSYNPGQCPVWANPLSLAATHRISIDFFSCRYLDVSVPCVRLHHLCIQ